MHDFNLSNSHFRSFASSIHYWIARQKPFIHEFPQSWYISSTTRIFTNLVKAQPSSPTRYSSKPQNYNLIFPLLDDRSLEPLRICHRIESSPFFDSVSILIKSVFHLQNHFELDRFRLRKALKSILDTVQPMVWTIHNSGISGIHYGTSHTPEIRHLSFRHSTV